MERHPAEWLEGHLARRLADEVEGKAPHRKASARLLSRWRLRREEGHEALRSAVATLGDVAEVRHHHQAEGRIAGELASAARLIWAPPQSSGRRTPACRRRRSGCTP